MFRAAMATATGIGGLPRVLGVVPGTRRFGLALLVRGPLRDRVERPPAGAAGDFPFPGAWQTWLVRAASPRRKPSCRPPSVPSAGGRLDAVVARRRPVVAIVASVVDGARRDRVRRPTRRAGHRHRRSAARGGDEPSQRRGRHLPGDAGPGGRHAQRRAEQQHVERRGGLPAPGVHRWVCRGRDGHEPDARRVRGVDWCSRSCWLRPQTAWAGPPASRSSQATRSSWSG